MSATEELMESSTQVLRRMLDERGVEWTEGIARPELTQVRIDGKVVKFHPWQPNTLKVSLFDITPEQAIAAILGLSNCSNNCTNSERTDATRLPHFWTHDGTLHVEATRMPTRIVVCEGGTCEFVPKRELDASEAENAKLRERITTQKQTIQAYRDESREWREVAECAQAENAKLRELVKALLTCATDGDCDECRLNGATPWHVGKAQLCDGVWDRVRELGIEADG